MNHSYNFLSKICPTYIDIIIQRRCYVKTLTVRLDMLPPLYFCN